MIEDIKLSDFPHSSGVYLIKDVDGVIIYVGSSKDLYMRMARHRSYIKKGIISERNKELYQYLQSNQFTVEFQLSTDYRHLEQKLIEEYKPKYNQVRAFTDCGTRKGRKTEYMKSYREKYKEEIIQRKKQSDKQYYSRRCNYNGETLTLNALRARFIKAGIPHPVLEAKKYLIA